ncbi:MAG: TlpA disulfide reductase family protein [Chloroflexota bacterium]|nr:TlpA disulfide reductase family protein [Chloroflexota bacterium]
MKTKRWYIDVMLVLIVVVLGVLVFYRLRDVVIDWRGDETAEANETAETGAAGTERLAEITTEAAETIEATEEAASNPPLAPEFTLTNLESESVSLSDYRGTPVMVNFWATWCPPCRAEMPLIQEFQDDFEGKFVVLAVNGGESEAEVRGFMEANDFTVTFLLDPENSVAQQYGVRGFPTSLFIDTEGFLQAFHIGELDENLMTSYLAEIGVGE